MYSAEPSGLRCVSERTLCKFRSYTVVRGKVILQPQGKEVFTVNLPCTLIPHMTQIDGNHFGMGKVPNLYVARADKVRSLG